MKRFTAASSTALLVSLGSMLWLACAAGFAADASKSDDAEARRTQQRLEDAQKRLERAAQEVAELSMSLSEEEVAASGTRGRKGRALLGVNIGSDEDEDRDEGVEVLSVSPGGGAANAGIKRGDVLLAVNNKALKRDEDGSARNKLLAAMRNVKPGDKVTVKYRRGDDRARSAEIVTKAISERVVVVPRVGKLEPFEIPSIAFAGAGSILGNAELVPLTPKLGQYFGTERGLLVVRAPSDDELELEEGDVILEIDGRAPNSTSHAMRILSSYQPGEKLTLNVMRRKRRTNIEVVVPESVPRAQIERSIDRSLRHLPALQQFRRGISVTPPAPPRAPRAPIAALAPTPPLPALAPLPPRAVLAPADDEPPAIEIQPLPEAEVEVETVQ